MESKSEMRCKRIWVQDVRVSAELLETRLNALRGERGTHSSPAQDALDAGVVLRLEAARNAALRRDPVPSRVGNWWRGTLIEAAYQNLHAAESLIALLYTVDEVEAEIPEAAARVEAGLARDDPRRIAALELLDGKRGEPGRREKLSKAIEVGFGASDADHARLRSFRNTVLIAAAVLTVLLGVFTLYVLSNPNDVPFCFTPAGGHTVCPSGDSTPSRHDVVAVAILGVLGGMLSGIVSIKNMQGTSVPYDVPGALALLKLPLGALSAVAALIAIRGGFIPGFSDLDSQSQILAYAFGFGVAQQLLTGLIDKRAQSLLGSAPGKGATTTRTERHPSQYPAYPADGFTAEADPS